jgi:hypothetical protein
MNQEYLFGMCDIAADNYLSKNIDYRQTSRLLEHLGVKAVRNWMHFRSALASPDTVDPVNAGLMKKIVADLISHHFLLIGLNHTNFHLKEGKLVCNADKLSPSDPSYQKWLEDYARSFETLVRLFPEITYWEIDNECNNDVFCTGVHGEKFDLETKARIFTDLMYYGSKGIHAGNPKAQTVMGGLVTWGGPQKYLEMIYDLIASSSLSKNPDDYFQVACWHPYMDDFSEEKFRQVNNSLYAIVREREKKDKDVFLTELGWSEYNVKPEIGALYLKRMFALIQKELPYIKTVEYFRIFDDTITTWGSPAEKIYGMIRDPKTRGAFKEDYQLGQPKALAYAYQEAAGGKGSLKIFEPKTEGVKKNG